MTALLDGKVAIVTGSGHGIGRGHAREVAKVAGGPTYGRIINTTSGAGLHGNFGQTNYATAKAAIVGLTQTLSLELASIGVTANVISPGGLTRLSSGTIPGAAAVEPDE